VPPSAKPLRPTASTAADAALADSVLAELDGLLAPAGLSLRGPATAPVALRAV
jgi:hypothetical protein